MTRHVTSIVGIILLALSDTMASGCLWIWQLPLIGIAFLIFEGTGVMMYGIITMATPSTITTSSSFRHSRLRIPVAQFVEHNCSRKAK